MRNVPFLVPGGPQGAAGPFGPENGYLEFTYYNRSGATVVKGTVLQVDTLTIATETTTADNASTSMWGNAITPRAGFVLGREHGYCVVALETIADNAAGRFCAYGRCKAHVVSGGTAAIGDDLVVTTGKRFDAVAATGERIFAIVLEAASSLTTIGSGDTVLIHLDNGWGVCNGIQAQTAG